jgi:DNA helicase HerA-like ATPase
LNEYPFNETDIQNFEQFTSFCRQARELESFTRVIRFHIDEKNHEQIFEMMIRCLYELGDVMIVIEETQDYCSPYKIGHYFKKAMTSGRHKNLGFIFTTQRPALISKTVLAQCTHVFVGNLIDKNDSDTMATLMRQKSEDFALLKDREFFWFCPMRQPPTIKINSADKMIDSIKK